MGKKKDTVTDVSCSQGSCKSCGSAQMIDEVMRREESLKRRTDENGVKWWKAYFGSGAHYRNWLDQTKEVFGEKNLYIEEVPFPGLRCFEESDEKAYRIWVKEERQ